MKTKHWYFILSSDFISLYASWREVVKNHAGFPPCVLSTPDMLKFRLVFQAGMSNVVWTGWLWQPSRICLREIPIVIWK